TWISLPIFSKGPQPRKSSSCRAGWDGAGRPQHSAASRSRPRSTAALCSPPAARTMRSEEHTSELQSRFDLVCRLLLEKKNHNVLRERGAAHPHWLKMTNAENHDPCGDGAD